MYNAKVMVDFSGHFKLHNNKKYIAGTFRRSFKNVRSVMYNALYVHDKLGPFILTCFT